MNLLDRIKEATIYNIMFMFFVYSVLFMFSLIYVVSWLMWRKII